MANNPKDSLFFRILTLGVNAFVVVWFIQEHIDVRYCGWTRLCQTTSAETVVLHLRKFKPTAWLICHGRKTSEDSWYDGLQGTSGSKLHDRKGIPLRAGAQDNNRNSHFKLKEHPLAVIIMVIIATSGICWKIFHNLFQKSYEAHQELQKQEIRLRDVQIEFLKEKIEELEKALAARNRDEKDSQKILTP